MYNNYSYNKDIFFQQKLTEYTQQELLEYEKLFLTDNFEHQTERERIIRRLLHTKFFSFGEELTNIDLICIILLHVPYITTKDIEYLNICASPVSIRGFLFRYTQSENNKKGKLKSISINSDNLSTIRKAYTLTPAARLTTEQKFASDYLSKYTIQSPKISAANYFLHDVMVLHIFYYLLADIKFPFFRWISSPFLEYGVSISESLKNSNRSLPGKEQKGIRPDAIISLSDEESYIYIEQDMCTESLNTLVEKLERYATFFGYQDLSEHCISKIYFSVYCDTGLKKRFGGKKLSPTNLSKLCVEIKNLLSLLQSERPQSHVTLYDVLKKLNTFLDDETFRKSNPGQYRKFGHMQSILTDLYRKNETAKTIEDLNEYINSSKLHSMNLKNIEHMENSQDKFKKRLSILRKAVEKSTNFQTYLLNGGRLVVSDCNYLNNTPILLMEDYFETVLLKKIVPAINKKQFNVNLLYYYEIALMVTMDDGTDCILRNHLMDKNNTHFHLCFENLSQDIGAEYRIRKFLEHQFIKGEQIFLYLLVSNFEDALSFNNSFNPTIVETFAHKQNCLLPASSICISYLCYNNIENLTKPFGIDYNGKIIYY